MNGAVPLERWLESRRALVDEATWAIALATALILWRTRRVPEPVLILAAGLVGLLLPR